MAQVILTAGLAVFEISLGTPPAELQSRLARLVQTPGMFIALAACGQLAFGLAAIIPAWKSKVPFRDRLGLGPPCQPWSIFPLTVLGSLVPLAVALAAAWALAHFVPGDPSTGQLFEQITPGWAVVFVVFIAAAPGLCEELLFRGYMQRRLLERWSPAVAILVTSIIFALMHIMPHAMLAAFPLGLWIGVIAWRSGSIWPGVACHAFVNGSLNLWRMIIKFGEVPDAVQWVVEISALLIGAICFVLAIRQLKESRPTKSGRDS